MLAALRNHRAMGLTHRALATPATNEDIVPAIKQPELR